MKRFLWVFTIGCKYWPDQPMDYAFHTNRTDFTGSFLLSGNGADIVPADKMIRGIIAPPLLPHSSRIAICEMDYKVFQCT